MELSSAETEWEEIRTCSWAGGKSVGLVFVWVEESFINVQHSVMVETIFRQKMQMGF